MNAPPGRHERADRREKEGRVGNMLDHFERQHGIETRTRPDERFGVALTIVDGEAHRLGMGSRRCNRLRVCVDPRHRKAETRHRLGGQTAAAADIEQAESLERTQRRGLTTEMGLQFLADKPESGRIDPV